MRDLLPSEAEGQSALAASLITSFERFGYQPVSVPVFEYASVLERGLGFLESRHLLRFVEPETGEVVVLRPDLTPQIARLVATRFADVPLPARLSYQGFVLRRQHERARSDQQILQAGIELIGDAALGGDLEILRATTAALRAAGLSDFVLDLGHGAIASSLLEPLPAAMRAELLEALSRKDEAELTLRASLHRIGAQLTQALVGLLGLSGSLEVFERARRLLGETPAAEHVAQLESLARAVVEEGLAPGLVVDLGETRTVPYYTGAMFQVLAEGPGQAVASGGRYDALLGNFGLAVPAAGAAIHVDHLRWALGAAPARTGRRVLFVSTEPTCDARALGALRAAGLAAVPFAGVDLLGYARAWRFDYVLSLVDGGPPEGGATSPAGRFSLRRVTETELVPVATGGFEDALQALVT